VSLAFLFSQKVTPLSQWSKPKDDTPPRPSDTIRKHNHIQRIQQAYECLTKPMTALEVSELLGITSDCAYKYLLGLYREKKIHRSSKQPYVYWKL